MHVPVGPTDTGIFIDVAADAYDAIPYLGASAPGIRAL